MDPQQYRAQAQPPRDFDPNAGCKIYITGIQPKTTKEQLGSCFAACGIIRDSFVMSEKGYGFITFDSPEAAAQAAKMSGRNFG